MGDLESFSGFDSGADKSDPAAFERFKERIKAAAAGLQAMQKVQQKQKKTEDELARILLKFITTGQNRELLLLISRLLEDNVPASFIVSLLLISHKEIQQELGLKMLPSGSLEEQSQKTILPDLYFKNQALPLKIKIMIDNWVQQIMIRSSDNAERLIKTVVDPEGLIKLTAVQLGTFCLRDFLESEKVEDFVYEGLKDFIALILAGIIQKLTEQESQKLLNGGR